jgi:hypothetical protein
MTKSSTETLSKNGRHEKTIKNFDSRTVYNSRLKSNSLLAHHNFGVTKLLFVANRYNIDDKTWIVVGSGHYETASLRNSGFIFLLYKSKALSKVVI